MNWALLVLGFFFIIISFKATHVSSTPMGGSKPLYPVPRSTRAIFFGIGAITIAYGLARLLGK